VGVLGRLVFSTISPSRSTAAPSTQNRDAHTSVAGNGDFLRFGRPRWNPQGRADGTGSGRSVALVPSQKGAGSRRATIENKGTRRSSSHRWGQQWHSDTVAQASSATPADTLKMALWQLN